MPMTRAPSVEPTGWRWAIECRTLPVSTTVALLAEDEVRAAAAGARRRAAMAVAMMVSLIGRFIGEKFAIPAYPPCLMVVSLTPLHGISRSVYVTASA